MPLQGIHEELLYWSAQGLTDEEVSKKIKRSLRTVRRYKVAIKDELKVQNEAEAVFTWLKQEVKNGKFKLSKPADIRNLTDKETEVLELVAMGYKNEAIANKLGLSPNTIKTFIKRILRKLQAKNREHAVYIGIQAAIL